MVKIILFYFFFSNSEARENKVIIKAVLNHQKVNQELSLVFKKNKIIKTSNGDFICDTQKSSSIGHHEVKSTKSDLVELNYLAQMSKRINPQKEFLKSKVDKFGISFFIDSKILDHESINKQEIREVVKSYCNKRWKIIEGVKFDMVLKKEKKYLKRTYYKNQKKQKTILLPLKNPSCRKLGIFKKTKQEVWQCLDEKYGYGRLLI